jgi:hypothetical protein
VKALSGLSLVARYLLGAFLSWLVFPVEAVLAYLALLLWAVVTGAGLGGPLAIFLFVIVAGLYGAMITVLVTLPAVAIGEFVGRRAGRWWLAPVAALAVGLPLLCAVVYTLTISLTTLSSLETLETLPVSAVLVAPAIVVFIVVTHGGGVLTSVLRYLWRRRRSTVDAQPAGGA